MKDDTYNNGKDLMLEDLVFEKAGDSPRSDNPEDYILTLAISGDIHDITWKKAKLYMASGDTKQEAVRNMRQMLNDHFERIEKVLSSNET